MKRTTIATAAALCALTFLASCATHADGRRMTLAEQWRAMAERQDAAARNFVDTGMDHRDPAGAGGAPVSANRSARFTEMGAF